MARTRRGGPRLAAVRRRRPGPLPAFLPGRDSGRLDQLAGRPARGLHRRSGGRRPGPPHLLGRQPDPGDRLDPGRGGPGRQRRRAAGEPVLLGLRGPAARRAAPAAAVRPGQRPRPRNRRDRPADRPGQQQRAGVLEALPGRLRGQALDRHRRRPPVHPDPDRPEHPVHLPHADRRPAVLPVRPRGHREHLLLRPGRYRPHPAHRPRRHVRQEPQHRRAPHRLPRRGRHLDAGRPRGRRTAPGADHPRLPVRGPRPAPGHRRATTWAAWTATRPGRPAWWRCAARCTG